MSDPTRGAPDSPTVCPCRAPTVFRCYAPSVGVSTCEQLSNSRTFQRLALRLHLNIKSVQEKGSAPRRLVHAARPRFAAACATHWTGRLALPALFPQLLTPRLSYSAAYARNTGKASLSNVNVADVANKASEVTQRASGYFGTFRENFRKEMEAVRQAEQARKGPKSPGS